MTAPKLPCVCGCPPGRHLMGKRDCRSCQTCSEYEPAEPVTAGPERVALDVTALLGEVQADADREAELASRLAEVEQERDQLAALVDQKQSRLLDMSDLLTAARARVEETERERDVAQAKLDGALLQMAEKVASAERSQRELADLAEHIPCGWCDGLGVAPGERFGRDADGAPNVDEDRPCPEGCEVPAWLQAERNDAADNERELAEARQQIERLTALLEQAEHYAHDLQDRGIEPAAERLYDTPVRYLCPICGGRYREHHNHPCGRLVPVRVRITFIKE